MEILFEYLPGIVFLVFILKKIVDGYKDIEVENKPDFESKTDFEQKNQDSLNQKNQKLKASEVEYNFKLDSDIIDDSFEDDQNDVSQTSEELEETDSDFKADEVMLEKKKKKKKNIKSKKDDNNIIGSKIKSNDIIKGIVFKEILGKPRSKKPYQPPQKR
jgi:hypothetical protein